MAVAAAALSALLATLGSEPAGPGARLPRAAGSAAPSRPRLSPCPPGTLPDHGVCIPVPRLKATSALNPRWRVHDLLPKLPERPADYARYRYPVDVPAAGPRLLSSAADARHAGLAVAAEPGATVRALALSGQVGPATVIYAGPLVGTTVVTLHRVTEHGRKQQYLIVDGALGHAAPIIHPGAKVGAGGALGSVGSGAHLYLEVRRLRHGVAATGLSAQALLKEARSITCDPRNVLPLR